MILNFCICTNFLHWPVNMYDCIWWCKTFVIKNKHKQMRKSTRHVRQYSTNRDHKNEEILISRKIILLFWRGHFQLKNWMYMIELYKMNDWKWVKRWISCIVRWYDVEEKAKKDMNGLIWKVTKTKCEPKPETNDHDEKKTICWMCLNWNFISKESYDRDTLENCEC